MITARLVNLTPHVIMFAHDAALEMVPPSGTVARCQESDEHVDDVLIGGALIPLIRRSYTAITDLPASAPETYYIVSAVVAQAVPQRADVLFPANFVRDEAGRIIAAQALALARI